MLDIDLKVDKERILCKGPFNKVALTYKGISDDKSNILFSIYSRKGFSGHKKGLILPISDLEKYIDIGVEPFQIMVTEYNPDFITCYISGTPIRVITSYYV